MNFVLLQVQRSDLSEISEPTNVPSQGTVHTDPLSDSTSNRDESRSVKSKSSRGRSRMSETVNEEVVQFQGRLQGLHLRPKEIIYKLYDWPPFLFSVFSAFQVNLTLF